MRTPFPMCDVSMLERQRTNDRRIPRTNPRSSTYEGADDPEADAYPESGTVKALWQVQQCVIENNVIELMPSYPGWGAHGMALRAYPPPEWSDFRVLRRMVIRNNVIRFVDSLTEGHPLNDAIYLDFCEDGLVEGNIIDPAISAHPIRHNVHNTNIKYFNNRTPDGKLIQGELNPDPWTGPFVKQDELTTFVEDVTTMCIL